MRGRVVVGNKRQNCSAFICCGRIAQGLKQIREMEREQVPHMERETAKVPLDVSALRDALHNRVPFEI